MVTSHFPSRILITGYEVGILARLLKKEYPNLLIGAIDVLGNMETRSYADWKFSIIKQSPGLSFSTPKNRTTLEILYELTNIMLEDLEFDLLILNTPFNKNPNFVYHLSRKIEINVSNFNSFKKISSPYTFLSLIDTLIPKDESSSFNIMKLSEISHTDLPAFYVSKNEIKFLYQPSFLDSESFEDRSGYLLKFSQLYCAFFFNKSNTISFLGIQTISQPFDHEAFHNLLEKNALIPFLPKNSQMYKKCKSFFIKIIEKLDLTDFITFYFGLDNNNNILPIACSNLPDENFPLWQMRTSESSIVNFLMNDFKLKSPLTTKYIAFKLPIYSYNSIKVPKIPQKLAEGRNIAGVISHPNYPICTLWGTSSSPSDLDYIMRQKINEIQNIISSRP